MTLQSRVGLWATQQLAEFLAALVEADGESAVLRAGVERAAESMEAEIGAALFDGELAASLGFRPGHAPDTLLHEASLSARGRMQVEGMGSCHTAAADIERHGRPAGRLLLGRSTDEFTVVDLGLLRNMARVLSLALHSARTLAGERLLLASVQERHELLQRLTRIVRSISHRAPLQEVLDTITAGACELIGDNVAVIRQVDDARPGMLRLASAHGFSPEELEELAWIEVGQGAGGRAFAEERLVVIEAYSEHAEGLEVFRRQGLQSALAVPVRVDDRIVGTLTLGAYTAGRRYSAAERDAIQALAEHAGLALADARLLQDMREAQAAKDLFLAMVSHELKTPLTVMMGTLRTIEFRDSDLSDEARQAMIATAYRRGEELQRLIDRLLEGAKAELAGTVDVARLPDLVDEALQGVQHVGALERGPVADVAVRTDPQGAGVMLGILVENAIAHSPEGAAIEVRSTVDEGHAVVTVRNPGRLPAGLSPEELFMPFRRGPDASSPGVGLGLFIAARLATHVGAAITCSQEADSVCFHLRLPLAQEQEQAVYTSTSA